MVKQNIVVIQDSSAERFKVRCELAIIDEISCGWRYIRSDMVSGEKSYTAIILFELFVPQDG